VREPDANPFPECQRSPRDPRSTPPIAGRFAFKIGALTLSPGAGRSWFRECEPDHNAGRSSPVRRRALTLRPP